MRVCGLKGDATHLTPPASRLLHSKQLQQLFGISRPAITAGEYYCAARVMRRSCSEQILSSVREASINFGGRPTQMRYDVYF